MNVKTELIHDVKNAENKRIDWTHDEMTNLNLELMLEELMNEEKIVKLD
jgi:hypothetical protein